MDCPIITVENKEDAGLAAREKHGLLINWLYYPETSSSLRILCAQKSVLMKPVGFAAIGQGQ